MIRLGALGVGIVFVSAVLWGAVQPRPDEPENMAEKLHQHNTQFEWAFNGPGNLGVMGSWDVAQLQRGFQVYKEVCSACHSLNRVAFRDLEAIGFNAAQVKAIAAEYEVDAIDANGEPVKRKALPSDKFPLVYPNEEAARAAQNGALPPDLSLMTKARPDGTNYVASLLQGYKDEVPAGWTKPDTLYYNPVFHSINIAMPPPLAADGQVTYADGTPGTKAQYAKDIAAFLTWTAEPKLVNRKNTGLAAIAFLSILTLLGYLSYRKVWADIKKPKSA